MNYFAATMFSKIIFLIPIECDPDEPIRHLRNYMIRDHKTPAEKEEGIEIMIFLVQIKGACARMELNPVINYTQNKSA